MALSMLSDGVEVSVVGFVKAVDAGRVAEDVGIGGVSNSVGAMRRAWVVC